MRCVAWRPSTEGAYQVVATVYVKHSEPTADPFGERRQPALRERKQLLGGQFLFESDSRGLVDIVQTAYADLPPHRFPGAAPRFQLRLVLGAETSRSARPNGQSDEPPAVVPSAGTGLLCGATAPSSFVALSLEQRSALLVVAEPMLRFPYNVRYELLEFAVYTLAARVQGLVPLHAACVGRAGRGLLLIGDSGAGKSTVALHCLLEGLDFLAEDSVLVRPNGLLATGIASFLHIRADSLRFLTGSAHAGDIRRSPTILRRSGVEKLEIDLRRPGYRLAARPLRLGAIVFLSAQSPGRAPLLTSLRSSEAKERLAASQRYAASQPSWGAFRRQVSRMPAFELRRGRHPLEAVEALEKLLSGSRAARERAASHDGSP
jgi:hypothetical protein